jgi:hypothetical protein
MPQLEYVVAEALHKQPETRFASAADMIAALDAAGQSLDPAFASTSGFAFASAPDSPSAEVPNNAPIAPVVPPPVVPPAPTSWASRIPALTPRMEKWLTISGVGILVIIVLIAIALGGHPKSAGGEAAIELAKHAGDLLAGSDARGAADLLELALASPNPHANARVYLVLGHARVALDRRLDALGAYEHALTIDGRLATDPQLRANVMKLLDSHDGVSAVVALELLATRIEPLARDAIIGAAQGGKLPEVRHRAFAIAERLGIASSIDRVESWSLDLKQVTSCDERRTAVLRLRGVGDKRAIAALRRAQTQFPCVAKDAGDTIAYLSSLP